MNLQSFVDSFCKCNESIWVFEQFGLYICFNNYFFKRTLKDYNQTWNTSLPSFSKCFLNTIPTMIPMSFLLLMAPIEIYFKWYNRTMIQCQNKKHQNEQKSKRPFPYNWYNISRLVLTLLIIAINLAHFVYDHIEFYLKNTSNENGFHDQQPTIGDIWYSLANAFTYVSKNVFKFQVNINIIH